MVRAGLAAIALAALAGCGLGQQGGRAGVPRYELDIPAPGRIDVLTMATAPDDLRAVFDDVRRRRAHGDWWQVTIRCSSIARRGEVDPVLATGRYANTRRGLAETGLESTDEVEFATTGRRDCTPLEPSTPGAVTADEVIAAVEAEGLTVPGVRDGSIHCAQLGCLQRTVTDVFTVIVWPGSGEAQARARSVVRDVVTVGPVTTVEFEEESVLPPGGQVGAHEAAVERFAAARG